MTAAVITGIVTLILGAGSAFGWWIKRRDAKANPIPRQAAELALAKDALGIIGASRDALTEDVERLRADRETDRCRLDTLSGEVQTLRREVHTIRSAWTSWYQDLADRWAHHREQPAPPHPPTLDR